MIEQLNIKNLALLEKAELEPDSALSVFTGETGAGKSLMISALDLVSGGRASKEAVRHGASTAIVEAVFSSVADLLPEALQTALVEDGFVELEKGQFPDQLILAREISAKGKSFSRVNGRLVSLQRLHELGTHLLDIQSQRDQAALYDVKTHLPLLDRFAGQALQEQLLPYQSLLKQRKQLLKKQKDLGGDPAGRARELDLLDYQINEIEMLSPRTAEDEKLRKHRALFQHAKQLSELAEESLTLLSADEEASLSVQMDYLISRLQSAESIDERWRDIAQQANLLREGLNDLSAELIRRREQIEDRPELLEKIEQRLNQLSDLKRKYGPELNDVFIFKARAQSSREQLLDAEDFLQEIEKDLEKNHKALETVALALTELRQTAAQKLSLAIEEELRSLGMKGAGFRVEFSKETHTFGTLGKDQLQFLISTNPGEDYKALAKIASGGESARILLAVKLILNAGQPSATLVFDEVDAGVSGHTCTLIGEKLMRLAKTNQVFCVTHSAQIAACGKEHVLISKSTEEGRTQTHLRKLNAIERKNELARLLSGEAAEGAAGVVVDGLLERASQFYQSLL